MYSKPPLATLDGILTLGNRTSRRARRIHHCHLNTSLIPAFYVLVRDHQGPSRYWLCVFRGSAHLTVYSAQTSYNWWYSSLAEPFVQTLQSASFAINSNPDGGNATGIINAARNIDTEVAARQGPVAAYLQAFSPSNVTVLVGAHAHRVTFSAESELVANGVEFLFDGKTYTVGAKKEVVLCAGNA